MDKLIMMVAAYIAETLVVNGVIAPPRNEQEAELLLMICAAKFVKFANEMVPAAAGCNGDCDHCEHCETAAADPNRKAN